jgi:hypothetical protein
MLIKMTRACMTWPYRPEELALKERCYCRCGAPFASVTVGYLTLTACAAVLTGIAEGTADRHYREQPVARVDSQPGNPTARARVGLFVVRQQEVWSR